MDRYVILGVLASWCVLAVAASICLAWALASRRNRAVSTLSLCLWCALAGGALSGALWSWMTTTNWQFLALQSSRVPPGSPPIDPERDSMAMLKFFVHLDRALAYFLYSTVAIPLVGSILLYRRASRIAAEKEKVAADLDELPPPAW